MTRVDGPSAPPFAAIVSVGDELLLGETVDTNGSWLARELSLLGFRVVRRWVVGDDQRAIRLAVQGALDLAEVVLVTGGLGPTPDDLTRESVAALLEVPLDLDSDLLEGLNARFRTRGYVDLPQGSQAMAQVPRGGTVLPNPRGAAPGLAVEGPKGDLCILLPGVPREMEGIFGQGVDALLRERFTSRLAPAVHRVIHTFGVPESVLAEEVQGYLPDRLDNVTLAYLPDLLGVRLRLTARGHPGVGPVAAVAQAEANLRGVEDLLQPVLSHYRYEAESGDLAEAVGTALIRNGETLAVAESCTGGLISKRMTDLPGSSRYFLGGVVAYANEVKTGFLGVDGGLIERDGVVSESVAKAMAVGVAQKLKASVGIGVTGIAGPGGGSPEKPVGTVFISVFEGGETVARRDVLLGDREAVRGRAAHAALGFLLRILRDRAGESSRP